MVDAQTEPQVQQEQRLAVVVDAKQAQPEPQVISPKNRCRPRKKKVRNLPTEPKQLPCRMFVYKDGQKVFGKLRYMDNPKGGKTFMYRNKRKCASAAIFVFDGPDGTELVFLKPTNVYKGLRIQTTGKGPPYVYIANETDGYEFTMADYLDSVGFINPSPAEFTMAERDRLCALASAQYTKKKFATILSKVDEEIEKEENAARLKAEAKEKKKQAKEAKIKLAKERAHARAEERQLKRKRPIEPETDADVVAIDTYATTNTFPEASDHNVDVQKIIEKSVAIAVMVTVTPKIYFWQKARQRKTRPSLEMVMRKCYKTVNRCENMLRKTHCYTQLSPMENEYAWSVAILLLVHLTHDKTIGIQSLTPIAHQFLQRLLEESTEPHDSQKDNPYHNDDDSLCIENGIV